MTVSSDHPVEPAVSPPFAFVEGALDRADALRDDPDALAALWPQARVLLLEDDGRALADAAQALYAPTGAALGGGPGSAIFLGLRAGTGWFAQRAATAAPAVVAAAPQRLDLRSAAAQWPAFDATVFAQARALAHWHARHRYCSACGGELDFIRAGWLGHCRRCGSEHYPRTDQAIIAAVSDGTRLLLGRQRDWPPRRWSVIAGFVEPGESLEQTVAREVLEETGVRVRSCRYLASQPWPFPGALMLGFLAQADADVPVVGAELEDARWFDAASVRAGLARDWQAADTTDEGIVLSSPISIARWLIERWLQQLP
ncbi:NAD(+) diphosphatase [Cognatiluteimonas weifangensis]|uniref:NAD(+) diphosphatase n=1 Tax=Cognatiluteimonas weifangensis TaxID=2303539 RepID=A0A372DQQ1_9GAMM|nr:NAD(+) diphosphatase [Luteimonas weifangensis]RFP61900.1 NAD(+) diphosphatase [Luteimonas weifangensis]